MISHLEQRKTEETAKKSPGKGSKQQVYTESKMIHEKNNSHSNIFSFLRHVIQVTFFLKHYVAFTRSSLQSSIPFLFFILPLFRSNCVSLIFASILPNKQNMRDQSKKQREFKCKREEVKWRLMKKVNETKFVGKEMKKEENVEPLHSFLFVPSEINQHSKRTDEYKYTKSVYSLHDALEIFLPFFKPYLESQIRIRITSDRFPFGFDTENMCILVCLLIWFIESQERDDYIPYIFFITCRSTFDVRSLQVSFGLSSLALDLHFPYKIDLTKLSLHAMIVHLHFSLKIQGYLFCDIFIFQYPVWTFATMDMWHLQADSEGRRSDHQ